MSDAAQSSSSETPRRRRRRSLGKRKSAARRSRLRLIYFAIASLWGFLAGTLAVAGVMPAIGRPLGTDPAIGAALAVAAVIAVIGGAVAANAYRQASRRG